MDKTQARIAVGIASLVAWMAAAAYGAEPAGGEAPDDMDISDAVAAELLVDVAVPSHLIDVSTIDGVVELTGSVDSILARDRATELAETIRGVRSVVNRIDVNTAFRTDAAILNDAEQALLTDPATDSYEVSATVDDGHVTLSGDVDSWAEKQLCAEVAKGVKGVKELTNKITYSYDVERPAAEISTEVRGRLQSSPWVNSALIDISVQDSTVTLSGTVGSAVEKRNARNAGWVAGVTRVDADGLKVEAWASDPMKRESQYVDRSDEEVREAVKDALLYDPRVALFNVAVEVDEGKVTLRGSVDNMKAKKAAERDAMNTLGVWSVDNLLAIRPEALLTDAELEANVAAAIGRDPYLERWEIDVAVYNGKVFLNGNVDNWFEKSRAEDVAARVNSVVDVRNNLDTGSAWMWESDQEIKEQVDSQLFWSWMVDSDAVSVEVENGTATLTGTVDSWYERSMAEENAYEGGARDVVNLLNVDYGPPYPADFIYRPYYFSHTYLYEPYYGYHELYSGRFADATSRTAAETEE